MSNRHGSAVVTLPSDTDILITRRFDAPPALVWEALTRPEHVKRWYGLRRLTLPVCEIDLRPGGQWRYVMHDPEQGIDHVFSGEYREIAPPERLVYTERYEGFPGSDHVVTATLTERAGRTTLTEHMRYPSKEVGDGHLMSGMESGVKETYERLDELLASLVAREAPAGRGHP